MEEKDPVQHMVLIVLKTILGKLVLSLLPPGLRYLNAVTSLQDESQIQRMVVDLEGDALIACC